MKKLQSLLLTAPLARLGAFLAALLLSQPIFAQDALTKLNTTAGNVLEIITGDFVKTILVIALCASAICFGVFKDNDKMKRNAIAVGISAAILMTATFLVDLVWVK